VRNSIALACFLSGMFAGLTPAQCPQIYRNAHTVVPVQSCCSSMQPAYTVAVTQASCCPTQTSPCVRSYRGVQCYPVVQSYSVVQSYPLVQCITNSSNQIRSVVQQPTVTAAPAIAGQILQPNVQNNCNCSVGAVLPQSSPQASPQTASILEHQRNPFSLAGHARPCEVQYCLQEFLSCCESGGKDCMINYVNCTQITGEPLRHGRCPTAGPSSDD
jgi:hypothetical protein